MLRMLTKIKRMYKKKIGIYQVEVEKEPSQKVESALEAIRDSKDLDLLCFPEMWLTGFMVDDGSINIAQEFLRMALEASTNLKTTIILGTLPERNGENIYNTAFVLKEGKVIGKRRKYFLFEPMGEKKFYSTGNLPEALTVDDNLSVGVIICYELRFPELTKLLAIKGCSIIFCPAQWPKEREEHWRTLLRARAIESQIFMVGVNVVGKNKKFAFNGYSAIIDPYGNVILEISKTSGLYKATIDLKEVEAYRSDVPTIRDSQREGMNLWKVF